MVYKKKPCGVWCIDQECEGLRNITDIKRALWVFFTFQECEGLRSVADKKEPCGSRVVRG